MTLQSRSNDLSSDPVNIDDLTQLEILNEPSLLTALQARYENGKIYTYIGDVLVAINPYRNVKIYDINYHRKYRDVQRRSELPPHIFWVATKTYLRMRQTHNDQAILMSGESGAGKTESTKLVIQHLAHICSDKPNDLHNKLVKVNPLLEAFGNAETVINDNSSRFGKYIELHFQQNGELAGAKILQYMLEKSRVIQRGEGDRNFHIFYYFLAELGTNKRMKYGLDEPDDYKIVLDPYEQTVFSDVDHRTECGEKFKKVLQIMKEIGLNEKEINMLLSVLAAILHLGNVSFIDRHDTSGGAQVVNVQELKEVCRLLQLRQEDLERAMTSDTIVDKGQQPPHKIQRLKTVMSACRGRDALAKALYSSLFSWLVKQVNKHIMSDTKPRNSNTIGILDMSGFEDLPQNGFEQLLINVANEKLQYFFNEHIFSQEQTEMRLGGIDWNNIHYDNNGPILDLFMGNPMDKVQGLFDVVDDESRTPKSSDDIIVRRFHKSFHGSPYYERTSKGDRPVFNIRHFAGEVTYNAVGFREKNADPFSPDLARCVQTSFNKLIAGLFDENLIQELSQQQHKKTVTQSFRNSLQQLMDKLGQAQPLFVRCMKPNPNREARKFDRTHVTEQMRHGGLLELAKIRKIGFPVRLEKEVFIQRYGAVLLYDARPQDETAFCKAILHKVSVSDAEVGHDKVFLKEWHRDMLDEQVGDLHRKASVIQKVYRGYKTRLKWQTLIKKKIAEAKQKLMAKKLERLLNGSAVNPSSSKSMTSSSTSDVNIPPVPVIPTPPEPPPLMNQVHENGYETIPHDRKGRLKRSDLAVAFIDCDDKGNPVEPSTSTGAVTTVTESSRAYKRMSSITTNISAHSEDQEDEEDDQGESESMILQQQLDEDEAILPSSLWDVFRLIPRERISAEETFSNVLKVIKIFLYIFSLLIFTACLVINKSSMVLMTSTLHDVHKQVMTLNKTDLEFELTKRCRNTLITGMQICIALPHGISFFIYLFKGLFGSLPRPSFVNMLLILFLETVQTLATCTFVFLVLPEMDILRAVLMMNFVAFIPQLLKLLFSRGIHIHGPQTSKAVKEDFSSDASSQRKEPCLGDRARNFCFYLFGVLALLVQAAGLVTVSWGNFEFFAKNRDQNTSEPSNILYREIVDFDNETINKYGQWMFPLALFLISLTWWENFIDFDFQIKEKTIIPFRRWKILLHRLRQKSTMFTSAWNIGIILAFPYICFFHFKYFEFDIYVHNKHRKTDIEKAEDFATPLANGLSGFVGYFTGALACRLLIQKASFNIPLMLATPLTVLFLLVQCFFGDKFIPEFSLYIWHCPEGITSLFGGGTEFLIPDSVWQIALGGMGWISMIIITCYLWSPSQHPMDRNEKLFVRPFYDGVFLEQSMMLNRRRRDNEVQHNDFTDQYYIPESDDKTESSDTRTSRFSKHDLDVQNEDVVPTIYACATFWHETKNEMTQLLKSVFRMDKDHSKRFNLRLFDPTFKDKNYYEYETHILFDDAFDEKDGKFYPNQFVKTLYEVIDDSASSIHKMAITLDDPERMPTPYGGRLTWTLPGGTKLIAHLKNKNKIRHKKRWSQIMYMYYLMGYRLAGLQEEGLWATQTNKQGRKKSTAQFLPGSIFRYLPETIHKRAQNTFLLALDGDVDFKPKAVSLLVDQMKTNPKVAAACGRIHPIGNGPVVWFQKFEYAIGHWLQKAAEHVYGCVLCSPGCFSLFRASSLMDDNVMRRYSDIAGTAGEVIQFDQGEDRWLCTLLLQQGYRVTYCAASDALTYAPETFREFFNQRRRWMPSTMGNIMDLLASFSATTRVNDNISYLYMFYQFILFFASILGPGTTLMMIAGSYNSVLGTDLWHSNILAFEPIVFFVVICFTTRPDTHVTVAMFMSAIYALIMTIVLVGTVVNAITESISSPTVVFLATLSGFFLLAGLLHPQELFCLLPGILYFLIFPAAYLLLPLYSLCNMNVVSWGTREVPKAKTAEEIKKDKEEEEARQREKRQKKGLLNWLGLSGFIEDMKEFYRTMVGRKVEREETSMEEIHARLDELEADAQGSVQSPEAQAQQNAKRNELRQILINRQTSVASQLGAIGIPVKLPAEKPKKKAAPIERKRDDMVDPLWLEQTDAVGEGEVTLMDRRECAFWRKLICIYLHPIEKDKVKEKEMEMALKSLRTNIVFGFLMLNFLWAVVIFQFQLLKDTLADKFFIPIPRADDPEGEPMQFEPMSFAFLAVFGIVLFLQFVGTLIHRWNTFCHIMAKTSIHSSENSSEGKLEVAEKLQSPDPEVDLPPADYDDDLPEADYDVDDNTKPGQKLEARDSGNSTDSFGSSSSDGRARAQQTTRDPRTSLPSIHEGFVDRQRYPPRGHPNQYPPHIRPGQYPPYQPDNRPYPPHGYGAPPGYIQNPNMPPRQILGPRYARHHPRVGKVHVSGQTLHRNFQRRYNALLKDGARQTTAIQMEPGPSAGRPNQNFNDLYRTMRQRAGPRGNAGYYPPQQGHSPYRYKQA